MAEPLVVSQYLLKSRLVSSEPLRPDRVNFYETKEDSGRATTREKQERRRRVVKLDPTKAKAQRRMWGGRALLLTPEIAAQFTEAQRAVLSVIASIRDRTGMCKWPVCKIAAKAGTSRRVVQYTLAKARDLGLLYIRYRRNRANPKYSFPSVITVSCKEWAKHLFRFYVRGVSAIDFRFSVRTKSRRSYEVDHKQDMLKGKKAASSVGTAQSGSRGKPTWRQRYELSRRRGEDG